MSGLGKLPTRLAPAPHRLRAGGVDQQRALRDLAPWRKWYSTARWRRLRWSILVRDLFTCAFCQRAEGNTSLLIADHKEPHRGSEALFWEPTNLQCLCKPCHDSVKQAEEWAAVAQVR